MRLLFLPGIGCTDEIWNPIKPYIKEYNSTFINYPKPIIEQAESISVFATWLYKKIKNQHYDAIVAHSAGGLFALQLLKDYSYNIEKLILVETNLKPAEVFYRNLMLDNTTDVYKELVLMLQKEMPSYTETFRSSIQNNFDYTPLLNKLSIPIFVIYGDRGMPNYENRYSDLCLNNNTINKLNIKFVSNACHMPMMESPKRFIKILKEILK